MFGFLFHRKRQEVHKALATRINHKCFDQFRHANRRASRSPYCEVVWLIPDLPDRHEALAEMLPVVGKDISTQGMALVHTEPIEAERVIIGLEGQHGPSFILASVQHSTALGYGFYQIGLQPEEVLHLSPGEMAQWRNRLHEHGGGGGRVAQEPAAVGC